MVNISLGGCYIEAVLPGDIEGKPVVVLAEGAPLRGYVAHVEPQHGFGVQFSFDPAEQHARQRQPEALGQEPPCRSEAERPDLQTA